MKYGWVAGEQRFFLMNIMDVFDRAIITMDCPASTSKLSMNVYRRRPLTRMLISSLFMPF